MNLIADAGSTKTAWIQIADDGSGRRDFVTSGINALVMDGAQIEAVVQGELMAELADTPLRRIFFYGAGCIPGAPSERIRTILASLPGSPRVEVASDMLLAARSLCGSEAGIACILGTGSNSCLYDGCSIVDNISPLGYILGDEGSGAVLGRTLVADILKRRLSPEIRDAFFARHHISQAEILEAVYRRPAPNAFLASFLPFIADHITDADIARLVFEQFSAFIRRNVAAYEGWRDIPVHFAGTTAWVFADTLRRVAEAEGFRLGRIVRYPADGIVNYHISQSTNNLTI